MSKLWKNFDYDSYDWGCLRYMMELWIFLNMLSKQGMRLIRDFFNNRFLGDLIAYITDCMNMKESMKSVSKVRNLKEVFDYLYLTMRDLKTEIFKVN